MLCMVFPMGCMQFCGGNTQDCVMVWPGWSKGVPSRLKGCMLMSDTFDLKDEGRVGP